MGDAMRALVLALLVCCVPAVAAAESRDTITVGLYAPTAPFEGTGDRVAFVNALADHLAAEAGGKKVTGKVYSSASAFSAAVKKGEIQYAVIDAPYAAALGLPYKILASAVRSGESTAAWHVVAGSGISKLSDLRGKKVAIPTIGARQTAFLTQVLLDGEVEASYFGKVIDAADPRSALTMVSVGKADAAFVPSAVDVPGGLDSVLTLGRVGWPMFVALPGADEGRTKVFAARVKSFASTGAFSGFASPDAGRYRVLENSFGRGAKKGPMAVPPPARLTVRDILDGRAFVIPLSNVLDLVEPPATRTTPLSRR